MSNRFKKLLGNSAIIAVGSLGSRIISFILVPFYTFVLTTQQFGTVDLITTAVNMLLPMITLSIFDAVFRFVLDKDTENVDAILTNGILVTIIGSIVACFLIPLLQLFNVPFVLYIYILLISNAFLGLMLNFARAINMVKSLAIAGILGTFITAVLNILFLFVFKLGVQGYLLAIIMSNIFVGIFLIVVTSTISRLKLKYIHKNIIKSMLVYSLPLIPNAFSWWINNFSDRYFILAFVGASANGIYAVASKIPTLINVLNQIFFQAWQMSAVEEYNSEDGALFYSKTFNYFSNLQFMIAAGLLLILKPLMNVLVSASYYISWKYIPFLLLATIYSSLSGFIGTTYTAAKRTSGILLTTIIGAVVNIAFGIIFVPLFGIQGASLASGVSFLVILLVRLLDTQKFMPILFNIKDFVLNHIVIAMMIGTLFVNMSEDVQLIVECGLFALMILIRRDIVIQIYMTIFNRSK